MLITIVIAILSAIVLLVAGYVLGVKQGFYDREQLRVQLIEKRDVKSDSLSRFGASPKQPPEPVTQLNTNADAQGDSGIFKADTTEQPEQLNNHVVDFQSIAIHRGDLAHLMHEIVEKTGFKTVLLCDENGLPLASSPNIADLGRLAAISGFVVIFGERIRRNEDFMPVSLLFNDIKQNVVLSRIFKVGDQRLVITAVTNDLQLPLSALDSELSKVINLLSS